MDNQIPWVITLGQKTLGPYYKYIVKDFPKTLLAIFSLRYTTSFPSIIPLAMPFTMVYIEISLYPSWIHS